MKRLLVLALITAACGSSPPVTVETQRAEVFDGRLAVGATLGLKGAARSDIVLRIDLLRDGRPVRSEPDTLPRCAERCDWGTTFTLSEADRGVDDARVTIEDEGAETTGGPDPVQPDHRRGSDGIVVSLRGEAGRLLVLALRAGEPVGGVSLVVRDDDERITIPASDLPPHDDVSVRLFPGEGQEAWRS